MTELNFREYLETLPVPAAQDWGDRYTPTEAELPLAELPLKVQTVISRQDDPTQRQREAPKRFEVLAGLRDYAADHVLLVGKPGSGKSTALRRLLWEEAQKALSEIENGQTNFTIPVLIELRDRRQGSVVNWMQKSLRRVRISAEAIEDLLLNRRFLLLFDGVNEVPSPDVWSALDEFQRDRDFRTNPRIFTTRELGAGSDLGIEKKLEMLPLTESQMRQFIENRLPGRAENLLRQLKDRLRELAETPLLLKILCDVVQESPDGQLPQNRGELFRLEFIRRYEKFKPSHALPISGDSRRFTSELLQHLAFTMTQGDPHTDPCKPTPSWLIISKAKAEKILEDYLTDRVEAPAQNAKAWLEDLLRFKLLVVKDLEHIEFIHQLFQEYYAAEKLLTLLSTLSDRELKQNYLNYLKWTEAIAFMMGLVEDQKQSMRIVTLAIKENSKLPTVDLMLGAKLAGKVRYEIQAQTIEIVKKLGVPEWLQIELLDRTQSSSGTLMLLDLMKSYISNLAGFSEDSQLDLTPQIDLIFRGTYALAKTTNHQIVFDLLEHLEKSNFHVQYPEIFRYLTIHVLGETRNDLFLPMLLEQFEKANLRIQKIYLSRDTSSNSEFLIDYENGLIQFIVETLGKIPSEKAIPTLLKAFKFSDSKVRSAAAYSSGEIGAKHLISALHKALTDLEPGVRIAAAYALGNIGAEESVPELLATLGDDDNSVINETLHALVKIASKLKLEPTFLKTWDSIVPDVLKTTKPEQVNHLLDALDDLREDVSESAAVMLKHVGRPEHLSMLWRKYLQLKSPSLSTTIAAIQERCGFYNYEIAQVAIEEGKREKGKGETEGRNITYQIGSVGNIFTGTTNIHTKQFGMQGKLPQQDGECSD